MVGLEMQLSCVTSKFLRAEPPEVHHYPGGEPSSEPVGPSASQNDAPRSMAESLDALAVLDERGPTVDYKRSGCFACTVFLISELGQEHLGVYGIVNFYEIPLPFDNLETARIECVQQARSVFHSGEARRPRSS